ncbi:MAG TPA: glycosyltransferase family 2 protein [Bordetella sp.]|nr:glycosyltransferase family 2 protein [Bordetella sp.]
MTLSVIIIAKNEAAHIVGCLESVAFADEFIVVDSGSTDNTAALAREFGAQVHVTPDWPGFGPQKNRALDLATGDWVLSIDADERVTPELAREIQAVLGAPKADAYEIARLSDFCGRLIRHSGWWPDYVLRLFKRGTARFTDAAVHERVVPAASPLRLEGHFLHYPYPDLDALINKVNRYSSDAAAMMHARGKRATVFSALGHGFWTFIRIYLIRRGFLDGRHGLVLAVTAAAGSFFRYAKLSFLPDVRK